MEIRIEEYISVLKKKIKILLHQNFCKSSKLSLREISSFKKKISGSKILLEKKVTEKSVTFYSNLLEINIDE